MMTGSVPATAVITMRARGVRPCAAAYSGEVTSTADAPSTTPEELPAWWTWRISSRCGVGQQRRLVDGELLVPHGRRRPSWRSSGAASPGRRRWCRGGGTPRGRGPGVPSSQQDRHERLVEAALGDGGLGPVLAVDGQLVALLAAEPLDGGDQVGRDALGHHVVLVAEVVVVGGEAVDVERRRPGHGLDAAADDQVLEAGQDAHGGEVHGLLARAAEAVERDAGRVERPAGVERGHAGDVHGVVAAARAAAHDHVVDVGGVEAVALLQGVEHLGQDPLGVDGVEGTRLLALAPRRADGVDDPGFSVHDLDARDSGATAPNPGLTPNESRNPLMVSGFLD